MQPLSHVLPPSAATTADGHLSIGGCDLVALAEEHGTPLVVYDAGALRDTMRRYVQAFRAHDPHAEVIYASKAFWAQAVLRMVHEEDLRVDVASGGELFMALHAGFPPQKIVMHGNAKDSGEINEALEARVGLLVCDSLDEIALLNRIAGERGVVQDVLIRVKRTAICGTDIHIWNWDAWAAANVPVPMITGHEFAGEIVELGSRVSRPLKVGQRVSGEGHVVDLNSAASRAGRTGGACTVRNWAWLPDFVS